MTAQALDPGVDEHYIVLRLRPAPIGMEARLDSKPGVTAGHLAGAVKMPGVELVPMKS